MSIDFLPPLADMRDYPAPEFSMLPSKKGRAQYTQRPGFTNASVSLPIAYARNGLAIIARTLLPPGSKVLIPAYHCPALVEPFIWAQCEIDFYPLNRDLSPDISVLESKLAAAEAIVLVPFFGFKGDTAAQAELARKFDCIIIEDLAHAAHASTLHGDYGVTSLQKFYPISTGGELLIADSVTDSLVYSYWESIQISNWRWVISNLKQKVSRKVIARSANDTRSSVSEFRYFDPVAIGEPVRHRDIQQIVRHDHKSIATLRRRNYWELDKFLRQSRLGKPLFSKLDSDDVPYVYPFLLERAEYFNYIRIAAIPLYRWEEISPTPCETSALYRSNLIQLPCHQDLSQGCIDQIKSKLTEVQNAVQSRRI